MNRSDLRPPRPEPYPSEYWTPLLRTASISQALGKALDTAQLRADGSLQPVSTPWRSLNEALGGGFWPGLHVLSGATGTGRTQLAIHLAARAAQQGTPALYVSLELGADEIAARAAAIIRGQGDWSSLFYGQDRESLEAVRREVLPALETLPLRIEEAPGLEWNATDLGLMADVLRQREGQWPFVVVDYVQIVGSSTQRPQELRERVRSAAIQGREVARQGATVLLISSVARDKLQLLKGPNRVLPDCDPTELVGIGKESGEIEYSADTVLALSVGEFTAGATPVDVAVAKRRAGPTGWASLTFDGTRFQENSLGCAGRRVPRGF